MIDICIQVNTCVSLTLDLVEVMNSVEAPGLSAGVCLCSVAGAAAHRPAAGKRQITSDVITPI